MCGRFTLTLETSELQRELGLSTVPDNWQPRYNIAPSQPVLVIKDNLKRVAQWMRWGLIPSWAKSLEIGNRLINARSETLKEKPAFRRAFQTQRCLIPADGFFEWQTRVKVSSQRQPFYFHLPNHRPFMFAGLWDIWHSPDGSELLSCTIITCKANEIVSFVHDRMPVILDTNSAWVWLSDLPEKKLQSMLVPLSLPLVAQPVSHLVNKPEHDTPDVIMPVTD